MKNGDVLLYRTAKEPVPDSAAGGGGDAGNRARCAARGPRPSPRPRRSGRNRSRCRSFASARGVPRGCRVHRCSSRDATANPRPREHVALAAEPADPHGVRAVPGHGRRGGVRHARRGEGGAPGAAGGRRLDRLRARGGRATEKAGALPSRRFEAKKSKRQPACPHPASVDEAAAEDGDGGGTVFRPASARRPTTAPPLNPQPSTKTLSPGRGFGFGSTVRFAGDEYLPSAMAKTAKESSKRRRGRRRRSSSSALPSTAS